MIFTFATHLSGSKRSHSCIVIHMPSMYHLLLMRIQESSRNFFRALNAVSQRSVSVSPDIYLEQNTFWLSFSQFSSLFNIHVSPRSLINLQRDEQRWCEACDFLENKSKKINNHHVCLPHLSGWRIVTLYDTAVLVTYFSVLVKVLQCGLLVGRMMRMWRTGFIITTINLIFQIPAKTVQSNSIRSSLHSNVPDSITDTHRKIDILVEIAA